MRKEFAGAAPRANLTSSISSSDLSFSVIDGNGYPTGETAPFVVAIDKDTPSEEKILCSSRTGNVFSIDPEGRGFDGTTAFAHSANATVEHVLDAQTLNDLNARIFSDEPVPISRGGTGGSSAIEARTNLGVVAASHVDDAGAHGASASVIANAIVRRDSAGRISAATPTTASHVATKAFVEGLIPTVGDTPGTGQLISIIRILSGSGTYALPSECRLVVATVIGGGGRSLPGTQIPIGSPAQVTGGGGAGGFAKAHILKSLLGNNPAFSVGVGGTFGVTAGSSSFGGISALGGEPGGGVGALSPGGLGGTATATGVGWNLVTASVRRNGTHGAVIGGAPGAGVGGKTPLGYGSGGDGEVSFSGSSGSAGMDGLAGVIVLELYT
jgi:hypothetical protein